MTNLTKFETATGLVLTCALLKNRVGCGVIDVEASLKLNGEVQVSMEQVDTTLLLGLLMTLELEALVAISL